MNQVIDECEATDPFVDSPARWSAGRALVSVVIVNWNSRDAVLGCLRALAEHSPDGGCEVVVVDNGSVDGSVEAIRRSFPSVRVIANSQNRGLPAANNQGIAATSAPFVLIANPDTIVQPGAVDAMVDVLNRHDRAAFAIPRLLYEDGELQVSAGEIPTFFEAILGRRFQRRVSNTSGYWWDGWAHDEERAIGRGHEACYLVRRRAIEEVGLQDEAYVLDWEGTDWTARMRDAGWQIWFCPKAEVIHLGGVSIRQVQARWIISSHRGMYRFYRSRRPAALRPFIAATIAARAATKLIGSRLRLTTYEHGHRAK